MCVEHICNFDEHYGNKVKSAYRQRPASFALQSAQCSTMDAIWGYKEVGSIRHWCLWRILRINLKGTFNNEIRRRCWDNEQLSISPKRSRQTLYPAACFWRRYLLDGQSKTWRAAIEEDVESLRLRSVYRHCYCKQDWLAISKDLACNRNAWFVMIRNVHGADLSFSRR